MGSEETESSAMPHFVLHCGWKFMRKTVKLMHKYTNTHRHQDGKAPPVTFG